MRELLSNDIVHGKTSFNSRLVDMRNELGITQQQLSYLMSIPRSTLARIEAGETLPGGEFFIGLAGAFKAEQIYYLLTGKQPNVMQVEDEEREMLKIIRALPPLSRKPLFEFIKAQIKPK